MVSLRATSKKITQKKKKKWNLLKWLKCSWAPEEMGDFDITWDGEGCGENNNCNNL